METNTAAPSSQPQTTPHEVERLLAEYFDANDKQDEARAEKARVAILKQLSPFDNGVRGIGSKKHYLVTVPVLGNFMIEVFKDLERGRKSMMIWPLYDLPGKTLPDYSDPIIPDNDPDGQHA